MPLIHVAVGVIINQDNQVLISRRASHQHQGDKWEFPGGKVENNETSQEALRRELYEELGIQIQSAEHVTDIIHHYSGEKDGDKKVFLDVYIVREWLGEVVGNENQAICWVERQALNQYTFPAANVEILSLLADI